MPDGQTAKYQVRGHLPPRVLTMITISLMDYTTETPGALVENGRVFPTCSTI